MTITQKDLLELDSIRRQIKQLRAGETKLRNRILRDYSKSQDVEDGALTVEVSTRSAVSFSIKKLRAALGPAGFKELNSKLTPTQYQRVEVVKSWHWQSSESAEMDDNAEFDSAPSGSFRLGDNDWADEYEDEC